MTISAVGARRQLRHGSISSGTAGGGRMSSESSREGNGLEGGEMPARADIRAIFH